MKDLEILFKLAGKAIQQYEQDLTNQYCDADRLTEERNTAENRLYKIAIMFMPDISLPFNSISSSQFEELKEILGDKI